MSKNSGMVATLHSKTEKLSKENKTISISREGKAKTTFDP